MKLGRVVKVEDLRTVWTREERELTPWLAENIALLGEVLGLDLEVISREHGVGAFSLGILAKNTDDGSIVAIENQLELTDHSHLGQIITYASGVDAKTIVWISKEVREEHRKAVDWLNQITSEEMEFFAVEMQLVKIDDSQPAPLFKIKSSPNDWSREQKRQVSKQEGYTDRQLPGLTNSRRVGYDAWKGFPTGASGYQYNVAFRSSNRLSCELYIDLGVKETNKQAFDRLHSQEDEIERKIGEELSWERLDNRRACRIAAYTECTNDEAMLAWGIGHLKRFKEVFREYLV